MTDRRAVSAGGEVAQGREEMFSLWSMVQPPVTVPLRHLIHAFRSPKSTSVSVSASVSQNQHRDVVPKHEAPSNEPVLNLRGLGLSELKIGQIDQLVDRQSTSWTL